MDEIYEIDSESMKNVYYMWCCLVAGLLEVFVDMKEGGSRK